MFPFNPVMSILTSLSSLPQNEHCLFFAIQIKYYYNEDEKTRRKEDKTIVFLYVILSRLSFRHLCDDEKINCLVLIIFLELDNNRYTKKKKLKACSKN